MAGAPIITSALGRITITGLLKGADAPPLAVLIASGRTRSLGCTQVGSLCHTINPFLHFQLLSLPSHSSTLCKTVPVSLLHFLQVFKVSAF